MATDNIFVRQAIDAITGLSPYQPGKPIDELQRELGLEHIVKLASNENPLGPSQSVKDTIQKSIAGISQYPDGSGYYLKEALSQNLGVTTDMLMLGNGSNDVLDSIARVFLSVGREAVFSEYAFVVYAISTQSVGATACVAKASSYGHDLDAMMDLVSDKTAVVFIANPNNPTGTWLDANALESFVCQMPQHIIVVLDEAYGEYLSQDTIIDTVSWLKSYPNLIITRTFSKAYGLAGLRVGYAVSSPDIADLLNRIRQPFNVNSLALEAAETALQDKEYINKSRELNAQGLKQLAKGFEKLNLNYIPSVGNFIAVEVGETAADVYKQLLQHGVIVRPIAAYNMPCYLRVSVGLPEENDIFLNALEIVLQRV